METFYVILLVFVSSAIVSFILLFLLKWFRISCRCFSRSSKFYMVDEETIDQGLVEQVVFFLNIYYFNLISIKFCLKDDNTFNYNINHSNNTNEFRIGSSISLSTAPTLSKDFTNGIFSSDFILILK